MVADNVDNAYDAILVHFRFHSVETSLFNCDIVMGVIDGVIDYVSDKEVVTCER